MLKELTMSRPITVANLFSPNECPYCGENLMNISFLLTANHVFNCDGDDGGETIVKDLAASAAN